jgi:hypothetical protein
MATDLAAILFSHSWEQNLDAKIIERFYAIQALALSFPPSLSASSLKAPSLSAFALKSPSLSASSVESPSLSAWHSRQSLGRILPYWYFEQRKASEGRLSKYWPDSQWMLFSRRDLNLSESNSGADIQWILLSRRDSHLL